MDESYRTLPLCDISLYHNMLSYSRSKFLEGEAKSQRESFGSLQVGLLILLFAIYGLLALPLKSYVEPLIIMSVIPFGVIHCAHIPADIRICKP